MSGVDDLSAGERHLLIIERLPGASATMTIDGTPVKVVRIKVTPDQTQVLYEIADLIDGGAS